MYSNYGISLVSNQKVLLYPRDVAFSLWEHGQ